MKRRLELLESRVTERTHWHFLALSDGELLAVGECSDSGDVDGLVAWLQKISTWLAGRDLIADRQELLDAVRAQVLPLDPPARLVAATALGGIEQLLLDLTARRDGKPVWSWLDPEVKAPSPIPLYANINRMPGGRSPQDVGEMASAATSAGFTAVKCAPFDAPDASRDLAQLGLERVRAVRNAVGDDVTLLVDCHERLDVHVVHELLPELEGLGVGWLEDAVAIREVSHLAELKASTSIRLAGGELMFELADAAEAVAQGVVDVLMPDVKHAGGIEQALHIAHSLPTTAMSPHNPAGPVATAASAHLFAICANSTVLEYAFGEVPWRSQLVGGREFVTDGFLHLDDRPGLGVELDTDHPSIRTLWSAAI